MLGLPNFHPQASNMEAGMVWVGAEWRCTVHGAGNQRKGQCSLSLDGPLAGSATVGNWGGRGLDFSGHPTCWILFHLSKPDLPQEDSSD